MKLKFGITKKLFGWYFIFVLIFFGTVFVLYVNVHQMMNISENIVNKNYKISSASKKMIENLLSMEENEKKYLLLKKKDYLNYFISAQKEFEKSLGEILQLESGGMEVSHEWKSLSESYRNFCSISGELIINKSSQTLWIPETVINEWIQISQPVRKMRGS